MCCGTAVAWLRGEPPRAAAERGSRRPPSEHGGPGEMCRGPGGGAARLMRPLGEARSTLSTAVRRRHAAGRGRLAGAWTSGSARHAGAAILRGEATVRGGGPRLREAAARSTLNDVHDTGAVFSRAAFRLPSVSSSPCPLLQGTILTDASSDQSGRTRPPNSDPISRRQAFSSCDGNPFDPAQRRRLAAKGGTAPPAAPTQMRVRACWLLLRFVYPGRFCLFFLLRLVGAAFGGQI
ncbi:hypothetical protein EJB05_21695, partial [Eragrostis curvula]